jgi:hypothetical protein
MMPESRVGVVKGRGKSATELFGHTMLIQETAAPDPLQTIILPGKRSLAR